MSTEQLARFISQLMEARNTIASGRAMHGRVQLEQIIHAMQLCLPAGYRPDAS